jgi:hypothetical protein
LFVSGVWDIDCFKTLDFFTVHPHLTLDREDRNVSGWFAIVGPVSRLPFPLLFSCAACGVAMEARLNRETALVFPIV